jgi:hypothetical protein
MMGRFALAVLLATLLVGPFSGQQEAQAAPAPPPPPEWERLLSWLPDDTETLIVSQEPFEIQKAKGDEESLRDVSPFDVIRFLPVMPLDSIQDGLLTNELSGLKVVCAVEGSRHFTRPGEFGMMPYQGCHILEFAAGSDEKLQKAIKRLQNKAKETIDIGGHKVAVFVEQREQDKWSYFVCRPLSGILLIATDREYLRVTLDCIERKAEKRALAGDLAEWKHVDTKATIWAIRHYRKEYAQTDPTSPFNKDSSDADASATGFVFWFTPGKDKELHARYLSGEKNLEKTVKQSWHDGSEELHCRFKTVEPGVIEITSSIGKKEQEFMYLFVLLMQLGHAVVV